MYIKSFTKFRQLIRKDMNMPGNTGSMANKNGKIPATSQIFNWLMYVHLDFIRKHFMKKIKKTGI